MRPPLRFLLAALAALALALPARAQFTDAHWADTFFVPGAYRSGEGTAQVTALTRDASGALIAGGEFDLMDETRSAMVARWTGAAWEPLGRGLASTLTGVGAIVRAAAVGPDGALYVAGVFDHAAQTDGAVVEVHNVARWTGMQWEAVGGITGGAAYALATVGGSLYVGGEFTSVVQPDGTTAPAYGIARWDGAAWVPMGSFLSSAVYALAEGPDGRLLAGGSFQQVLNPGGATVPAKGLAAWDGAAWSVLPGGPEATSALPVRALLRMGAELYVGGSFQTVRQPDGTTDAARHIARWDGTRWDGLDVGFSSGGLLGITALAPDGTGGVYVGGAFTMFWPLGTGGPQVEAEGLARWTGSEWEAVSNLTGRADHAPFVWALLPEGAGGLVIGGSFQAVERADGGALAARNLVRYDGANWTPLSARPTAGIGGGPYTRVEAVATACGRVLAGGDFRAAGGTGATGLAEWDGAAWVSLDSLFAISNVQQPGVVSVIAPTGACVGGRPAFYVGGAFGGVRYPTSALRSTGVVYWNGAGWESMGEAFYGDETVVRALAVDPAGGVFAAPVRRTIYPDPTGMPVEIDGVGHWAPGAGWTPVPGGPHPATIHALALGPDGALYVGGTFRELTQPGGDSLAAYGVARWDGTAWTAIGGLDPNGWPDSGTAHALAFDADGALYVGGAFWEVHTPTGAVVAARNVARWTPGGGWEALGSGHPQPVRTLHPDGRGRVFAGSAESTPPALSVWDGAAWGGGRWASVGSGVAGRRYTYGPPVYSLALDQAGRLYVGGAFETAGGLATPYLAVYDASAVTPAEPGPDVPGADPLALAVVPNPVRGRAALRFALLEAGPVRLAAYDALGREVAVLTEGWRAAGPHAVALDAAALPAGVYLARLTAGAQTATRRLTVAR